MTTIRCRTIHYYSRYLATPGSLLTLRELSDIVHVPVDILESMLQWQLIEPAQTDPQVLFENIIIPKIRRIVRLRDDLGINWPGIGVVLELLDRNEKLEREIAWLRSQMSVPEHS